MTRLSGLIPLAFALASGAAQAGDPKAECLGRAAPLLNPSAKFITSNGTKAAFDVVKTGLLNSATDTGGRATLVFDTATRTIDLYDVNPASLDQNGLGDQGLTIKGADVAPAKSYAARDPRTIKAAGLMSFCLKK